MNMQRDVTGWVGWIVFAAVIMVMLGVFAIIGGLIAILDDSYTSGPLGTYAESTANARRAATFAESYSSASSW